MNVPLQTQQIQIAEQIASKTIEYLQTPSVVGYERFFMQALEKDFKNLGLRVNRQDRYLTVSGDQPHSSIICAHLDRHGLISLGNDEYVYAAQYIKEIKYGQNNRLAQKQLENITRRFEKEVVFAYDPTTGEPLGNGIIKTCNPCLLGGDALFFIENMPPLASGLPLAYARTATYQNNYLKGQIDNVVSLATVFCLFKYGFQGTAILATEEEIGKSWLHISDYLSAYQIETQNLITIDTSPYTDQSVIENGVIILRKQDMSGQFNTKLVNALISRATELGLPFEIKDEAMLTEGKTVDQLGSTELGRLVEKTQGRWNGATIQIPTSMYHTSNETTTTKAIANYYSFLRNTLIDDPLAESVTE